MLKMRFCITIIAIINLETQAPQFAQAEEKSFPPAPVKEVLDIGYFEGKDKDSSKHKLDIYLPSKPQNAPVFFFVHGGAWVQGDKNFLGIYSAIGRLAAQNGMIGVVISYRLTPKVKHPSHAEDVARAISWTTKNIKNYGGDPERIILCGHSAGGHLVSLVSCDQTYFKKEDINPNSIKGVISISGVYEIPQLLLGNVLGKILKTKSRPHRSPMLEKSSHHFCYFAPTRNYPCAQKQIVKNFKKP